MNAILESLQSAAQKRQSLRRLTNALRLVNGAGDGLDGLILEQYNCHFVAQIFQKRWLKEKSILMDFVKGFGQAESFIVKERTESPSSNPEAFKTSIWIAGSSSRTIVEEYGLKFEVDLNDTLNSGLFLDMRRNRALVAGLSCGRKVLNGFAYTCSFGVHCHSASATSVANVDISAKNLARGRINYELNGLEPSKNEFIRTDAVEYLQRAVIKKNFFDLIILDPPSFARHEGKTFGVKKDLVKLMDSAVKALNPDGDVFVSTNFSEMTHRHLEAMVQKAAAGRKIQKIQRLGQDQDFSGSGRMAESCLTALLVRMS